MPFRYRHLLRTALWTVVSFAALESVGQKVSQPISVVKGWNAIYLSVAPSEKPDQLFRDWPVSSVSAYHAQSGYLTEANLNAKTSEDYPRSDYWVWHREGDGMLSTLGAVDADSVLVFFATNDFETVISGIPVAPRLYWKSGNGDVEESKTYVGSMLNQTTETLVSDFLMGSDIGLYKVYALGGTNSLTPTFKLLNTPFSRVPAKLTDGKAVVITTEKSSDWAGPLYVSPRIGVRFGATDSLENFTIRNDSSVTTSVKIAYSPAADLRTILPAVLWRDVDMVKYMENTDWTILSEVPLLKTLGPGETWSISFGLDRSKLTGSLEKIGGILSITHDGASKVLVRVPISATDDKGGSTLWPAGLWEVKFSLDKVSFFQSDGKRVNGLRAGGVMKPVVYLHIDNEGKAKLLQRVHVAIRAGSEGTSLESRLYSSTTAVPDGWTVSRLSSVSLPVDVPVIAGTGGGFPNQQQFEYRIAADSPSNPFYHALHPQFDGLKADFQTPAPNGDDFENYVGSVKPERFGFSGTITLSWDDLKATSWSPEETMTGTATWGYTGVRKEGPIVSEGTFTMRRIVKDGKLY